MPGSPNDAKLHQGTEKTREFYETSGWQVGDSRLVDTELFGVREDGPIRIDLFNHRQAKIEAALVSAERTFGPLQFLELGCGGNPELSWKQHIGHYTGVDFASTGLDQASIRLQAAGMPFDLLQADITKLPFADDSFSAVYCAHVLYHIDNAEGQAAAVREAIRVLKPGGVAVFVLGNPRPYVGKAPNGIRAL